MCRSTTTGKHPTGRTLRNKPTNDIRTTTTTSFPCPSILLYHHHKYQRGVGHKPRKQTPPSIDRKSSKRQVIIISQPTSESSRRDAWRVRYSYILSIYVFILILRRTYTHTHALHQQQQQVWTQPPPPQNVVIVLRYIICIPTCCLFVAKQERRPRSKGKHPRRSLPMILVGPFPAFVQNSHTHT